VILESISLSKENIYREKFFVAKRKTFNDSKTVTSRNERAGDKQEEKEQERERGQIDRSKLNFATIV
jgi:hypothetical protein